MNSGRSSPAVVIKSPQSLSPSSSAYLTRQPQEQPQNQQQQVPNDANDNDANVPIATDEIVEFEISLRTQLCSEVVGTYLLALIGLGGVVVSHYTNSGGTNNTSNATDSALWSLGAMLAIYSAASISGGHLNPAVTLAYALVRPAAFPARKILSYCLAQVLGACLGAVTIVVLFQQIMTNYEDATMSTISSKCKLSSSSSSSFVYGTSRHARPCHEYDQVHLQCLAPFIGSWGISDTQPTVANESHALFIEAFGTAVILFVVFSVTSPFYPIPGPAVPPVVAVVIGVMMYLLGPLTGQHLNPAIEIGRRVGGMAWLFYQSGQSANNGIPIVSPYSSELFRTLEMVGHGL